MSFRAHDDTVSSLSFSSKIQGMMATASIDKTVRVWDTLQVSEESTPKLVAYKSMNVGKLFTLNFCADEAYMLATAGDQGILAVWESSEVEQIVGNFDERLNEKSDTSKIQDFVIGCNDESIEDGPDEDTSWMDSTENGDDMKEKTKKKKKKSRRL